MKSEKINISTNEWEVLNVKIFKNNDYEIKDLIKIKTNFDYKRINSLYSDLSSLNMLQLYELRNNYKKLNYSLTEIDLQFLKLLSFPLFLLLITIFSSLIMFRVKRYSSSTFQISLGLFLSVIIYYANNFFYVLGSTEKLSLMTSVFTPLLALIIINSLMLNRINEK